MRVFHWPNPSMWIFAWKIYPDLGAQPGAEKMKSWDRGLECGPGACWDVSQAYPQRQLNKMLPRCPFWNPNFKFISNGCFSQLLRIFQIWYSFGTTELPREAERQTDTSILSIRHIPKRLRVKSSQPNWDFGERDLIPKVLLHFSMVPEFRFLESVYSHLFSAIQNCFEKQFMI